MLSFFKSLPGRARDLYLRCWAANWKLTLVLTWAIVALLLAVLFGCTSDVGTAPEAPSCDDGSCSV